MEREFSTACAVLLSNVACFAGPVTDVLSRPGSNNCPAAHRPHATFMHGESEELHNAGTAVLAPCQRSCLGSCQGAAVHSCIPNVAPTRAVDTADVGPKHGNAKADSSRHGARWQREQLQLLVEYVASLPPGRRNNTREALALLGWAKLPDPDGAISRRLLYKLSNIRHQLSNGVDPLAGRSQCMVMAPGTYNWREWLRRALLQLPNHEGTLDDIAAVLEADPDISPKLDRRMEPVKLRVPRWRCSVSQSIPRIPEIFNTGKKRNQLTVYRYDEEVARQLPGGRGPKVPKKGQQGLPHLGKKNA
ncbi:hypothetical protein Agub_g13398 [Astrephomene gubernaculifera]|uniref:Uncharacterized protein n=1 Tax=Astrephomene gubernaculifera TaxID=47775 RepID=A0AAD3E076_9CHLO|nr:hypothetical protein Agub_g13398 [Astrephomene gubernaculifera]